jgi:cytochrome c5
MAMKFFARLVPFAMASGLAIGVAGTGVIVSARAQAPAAASTVTGGGVTLHSVHAEMPGSDRMFPGPDADAINSNCLACHSAGMVLTQPKMSRAAWQSEVEKMRSVYKAPIAQADVPAIVAWLASHEGTGP